MLALGDGGSLRWGFVADKMGSDLSAWMRGIWRV